MARERRFIAQQRCNEVGLASLGRKPFAKGAQGDSGEKGLRPEGLSYALGVSGLGWARLKGILEVEAVLEVGWPFEAQGKLARFGLNGHD